MADLFLILHKVRGEATFDVASRLHCPICEGAAGDCNECDEGYWWILPTCGYRANPCRSWPLDDLTDISDVNNYGFHNRPTSIESVPADLPDLFPCNRAEPPATSGRDLLRSLGLVKALEPMRRI